MVRRRFRKKLMSYVQSQFVSMGHRGMQKELMSQFRIEGGGISGIQGGGENRDEEKTKKVRYRPIFACHDRIRELKSDILTLTKLNKIVDKCSCGHYKKKYYYKIVTGEGHSCSTKNMEHHTIYKDGKTYIAKKGTPGIMFFESLQKAEDFLFSRPKELNCKIKKIRPIGKIFNWSKLADRKRQPPIGSSCAKKIEIVEDI